MSRDLLSRMISFTSLGCSRGAAGTVPRLARCDASLCRDGAKTIPSNRVLQALRRARGDQVERLVLLAIGTSGSLLGDELEQAADLGPGRAELEDVLAPQQRLGRLSRSGRTHRVVEVGRPRIRVRSAPTARSTWNRWIARGESSAGRSAARSVRAKRRSLEIGSLSNRSPKTATSTNGVSADRRARAAGDLRPGARGGQGRRRGGASARHTLELAQDPLSRGLAGVLGMLAYEAFRLLVQPEAELALDADGAQPGRVVVEDRRRDGAGRAAARSASPPSGSMVHTFERPAPSR